MESNDFVELSKKLQAAMTKKNRVEKRIGVLREAGELTNTDIRLEIIATMEKTIEKKITQYRERQQKKVTVEQNKLLDLSVEIKELAAKIQEAIE